MLCAVYSLGGIGSSHTPFVNIASRGTGGGRLLPPFAGHRFSLGTWIWHRGCLMLPLWASVWKGPSTSGGLVLYQLPLIMHGSNNCMERNMPQDNVGAVQRSLSSDPNCLAEVTFKLYIIKIITNLFTSSLIWIIFAYITRLIYCMLLRSECICIIKWCRVESRWHGVPGAYCYSFAGSLSFAGEVWWLIQREQVILQTEGECDMVNISAQWKESCSKK